MVLCVFFSWPSFKFGLFLCGLALENKELTEKAHKTFAHKMQSSFLLSSLINTLFLQIGVSMSSLFSGTDRISLR